jgi:putative transposase
MVVRIAGKRMYLWRAVDHEGEILEVLVQRRRERRAAVKLMRKLMRKQGLAPKTVVTDCLSEVRKSARGGAISAGICRPRRKVRAVAIRHQREDASERRMPVRRFNRGGRAF